MVDPKFKETIYDPFCGTGGFLTEAFNYIKENNIINTDEDLEKLRFNTYYNGIAKNNGDAACVLHCLQNLKEGGRMALVVPEGVLIQKNHRCCSSIFTIKSKVATRYLSTARYFFTLYGSKNVNTLFYRCT